MNRTARTADLRTGSGSRRRRAGSSTHNGRYSGRPRSRSRSARGPPPRVAPDRKACSAPSSAADEAAGGRLRPVAPRPFTGMSRSGASVSRSAVPRVAVPSSGASRRSAVPINVSLPTAGRPLAPGSKNRLPIGCPACAALRRPGAACGSCGRFRPQFPMSTTSTPPRRFPNYEKFWPTPPRRRSVPPPLEDAWSGRQSPAMPGQLAPHRRLYGRSDSGRLFEFTVRR